MEIRSEPFQHTEAIAQHPGGYQWWYFDAASASGKYHIVIIFYVGNPFSTRYINALEKQGEAGPAPCKYPGISISVYENGNPIYYSFTEFEEKDYSFEEGSKLKMGAHIMEVRQTDRGAAYWLCLKEQLPCGDQLEADLIFESRQDQQRNNGPDNMAESHIWNLAQPRAQVEGTLRLALEGAGVSDRQLSFSGTGYHDHNAGKEPMKEEFTDWYWGRFHFQSVTLIYYVKNQVDGSREHQAWLLDPNTNKVIENLREIELNDDSWSIFGLRSSRKLSLRFEQAQIEVQQSTVVDNGPFYQRFLSQAFLSIPAEDVLESAEGITEYIRPQRIHSRIFWPLVNMRIRQVHQKPHWVQRSKRLYQWTW
ncbi:hypothetical protein [Fodinibius salsisoli]|uniref:Hydroxyneurosporene synthase (CrtC) n=1 Tax=Fodinibius salsisoli TaxID=2820877 RepID=A0ABT3PNI0_9BACT|nr:hypothetical protein [Fodinibius salsisoli]MCW9707409.1 hypothetical protein [Fodinibius salsisoli]